ncbi:MAG: 16S rRNA (cytidine(1402)-2'-O)-methyltransferase [Clostridia bacterium]|nr:16S rRNA (cytidine(1402)-2'-O)-methyltransferase [Clostridia bacterium]
MIQVYIVATPIGNSAEITYRAVQVLNSVDVIYCEDTRHSAPLLARYDIHKPLKGYHKFNEKNACSGIFDELSDNKTIAVITDAGMPAISDPGNILVNALIDAQIEYTVVSGASAFVNAFVMSGFSTPFTFIGFLPDKNIDRQRLLDGVNINNTLIFYSAVHDVIEDLRYLHQALGNRKCMVAREISKLYEQRIFGTLGDIDIDTCKGEFVIVVGSCVADNQLCSLSVEQHYNHYINCGYDRNQAIKQVAKDRGVPKNTIYSLLIKSNTQTEGEDI